MSSAGSQHPLADVRSRQKDTRRTDQSARAAKHKQEEEKERAEQEATRRRWEKQYSSEDSEVRGKESELNTYYCAYCGNFSLILDTTLELLPMRKADGAMVIDEAKRAFKFSVAPGPEKLIKRDNGLERQHRLNCKQCGLFLMYRSGPMGAPSKFTYICSGALTIDPRSIHVPDIEPDLTGGGDMLPLEVDKTIEDEDEDSLDQLSKEMLQERKWRAERAAQIKAEVEKERKRRQEEEAKKREREKVRDKAAQDDAKDHQQTRGDREDRDRDRSRDRSPDRDSDRNRDRDREERSGRDQLRDEDREKDRDRDGAADVGRRDRAHRSSRPNTESDRVGSPRRR